MLPFHAPDPTPRRLTADIPNIAPPKIDNAPAGLPAGLPSVLGSAPSRAPAAPSTPAPAHPATPVTATPGRIIWTGKLSKNGRLVIDRNHASTGAVSGALPTMAAHVSAYPGDLNSAGITLFTADPRYYQKPLTEKPGAENGWNPTTYTWDPRRAEAIKIIEQPGPQNGFKLVLESDSKAVRGGAGMARDTMKPSAIVAVVLMASPVLARAADFATEVHPILAARCAPCHSGAQPAAGLSLTSRASLLAGGTHGPAIEPGNSSGSLLILKVYGPARRGHARFRRAALRRSDRHPARLDRCGRRSGRKPRPSPPVGSPPSPRASPNCPRAAIRIPWIASSRAYFAQHALPFPAPVADALFARRVYFDLWGLPPTPAQLAAFLHDTRPDKRTRLIDALLADSEPYAENWISWWDDLLRNDPGSNYAGERKSITDWLFGALEHNLPYDQMISALVNPDKIGPDGFLIGVNWRGDINASQTPYMQAAQNTAQIFLGINLKCASCHDSFINRYKLRESYGMAALFSPQSQLELVRCDVKTGKFTGPQLLYPDLGTVPEDAPLAARHAAAAQFFTDPRNGRVPRTIVNRYWQRLFGRGLVEPVDEMDGEPWNADLLDWLASDFTAHGSDLKYLLRLLMTSRAYQLPAVVTAEQAEKPYVFRGPPVRRLTAEEFADTVSAITGEWRLFVRDKAAIPARDWRFKASPLSLALGRPIRDQVFTTRDNRPTTFQALELVNGATLEDTLRRGALRLLDELPPAPREPVR